MGTSAVTFGDIVEVRSTPDPEALGVSALIGPVYGETIPCEAGVVVVGPSTGDYANRRSWSVRAEPRRSDNPALEIDNRDRIDFLEQ